MITDRPNDFESVIEHDGAPVVIVRWPGGDSERGKAYARKAAQLLEMTPCVCNRRDERLLSLRGERDEAREQLAEADAAIARLTRERDDMRAEAERARRERDQVQRFLADERRAAQDAIDAFCRERDEALRSVSGADRVYAQAEIERVTRDRDEWKQIAEDRESTLSEIEEVLSAADGEVAEDAAERVAGEEREAWQILGGRLGKNGAPDESIVDAARRVVRERDEAQNHAHALIHERDEAVDERDEAQAQAARWLARFQVAEANGAIAIRERDEARTALEDARRMVRDGLRDIERQGNLAASYRHERDEARAAAAAERVAANEAIAALHDAGTELVATLGEVARLRAQVASADTASEQEHAEAVKWQDVATRHARQLALAMHWGREATQRAAEAELAVETWLSTCADADAAEIARLRERVSFYELGNVPRLLGIAPDQLEVAQRVLRAAYAWHQIDPALGVIACAALETACAAWRAAGKPLAGVPSPASEGSR